MTSCPHIRRDKETRPSLLHFLDRFHKSQAAYTSHATGETLSSLPPLDYLVLSIAYTRYCVQRQRFGKAGDALYTYSVSVRG